MTKSQHISMVRQGLTLLEVLIALALFVMAMAIVGQLIGNAMRAAMRLQTSTQAAIRCHSKLAEVVAGIERPVDRRAVPFDDDPRWSWSLLASESQFPDLLRVEVTVEHRDRAPGGSVSSQLSRFVRKPDVSRFSSDVRAGGVMP